MSARLPAVFFGHGSPIIALQSNATTDLWKRIGDEVGDVKAILCVSAHWLSEGTEVTGGDAPKTIHDFGAFPEEMFRIRYPAPGSAALCSRVAELLSPERVTVSQEWGYDHGCWTVLMKAFPDATIPVVQLSLDVRMSLKDRFETGRRLRALRSEGVLLMGSGNLVHNLRDVIRKDDAPPHPYASRFGDYVREAIARKDSQALLEFPEIDSDTIRRAQPTPDHLWPLYYILGASEPDDEAVFEDVRVQYGSVDMTTIIFRRTTAH